MKKSVMQAHQTLYFLLTFSIILALCVIILGAYTRLTQAGLGCPDWPLCYGQVMAPTAQPQIQKATEKFSQVPIEPQKAWTEMIHRYVAGTLGLFVIAVAIIALRRRGRFRYSAFLPIALLGIVIFQALLGKWTVTMKLLPIVVMSHLLGGITLLSLLWWLRLRVQQGERSYLKTTFFRRNKLLPWAIIGSIIVALQIILGGWVSANYAGLACGSSFPACQGQLFFPVNFFQSFHSFGGALDGLTRMSIQILHRFGAVITLFYIGILALKVLFKHSNQVIKSLGGLILFFLLLQFLLGILNVIYLLPLGIAVGHTTVAVLLFLSLLTLVFKLKTEEKSIN